MAFVTSLISIYCKTAFQKVLSKTSKGRQLALKRASFTSQLGVNCKLIYALLNSNIRFFFTLYYHSMVSVIGEQGLSGSSLGSFEIWSDKLKVLYNKVHRVTEETEVKAMSRRCDGTKSDGGVAYRFQITFGIKALSIKLLKSLQTSSVALCTNGASVATIFLF